MPGDDGMIKVDAGGLVSVTTPQSSRMGDDAEVDDTGGTASKWYRDRLFGPRTEAHIASSTRKKELIRNEHGGRLFTQDASLGIVLAMSSELLNVRVRSQTSAEREELCVMAHVGGETRQEAQGYATWHTVIRLSCVGCLFVTWWWLCRRSYPLYVMRKRIPFLSRVRLAHSHPVWWWHAYGEH